MKHIATLLFALVSSSAIAGEYTIQEGDCRRLGQDAQAVADKHKSGDGRNEVIYHLLNKQKLGDVAYLATAPMLFSITADLYSGDLAVDDDSVGSSIESMCRSKIGTVLQYNDEV